MTHSSIHDAWVGPVDSGLARRSPRTAYAHAGQYRVVLYWRPIVPGLNAPADLATAADLSRSAHAAVFTGLFYRQQIRAYYRQVGLPEPYPDVTGRKILPAELERQVLDYFAAHAPGTRLFRKTSCAVSYTHGLADFNGHYGIPELFDICPAVQVGRRAAAFSRPGEAAVAQLAARMGAAAAHITDGAMITTGLDEQRRYWMQHQLGYQVHDSRLPHIRAGTGARRPPGRRRGWRESGARALDRPWRQAAWVVVDVEGNGQQPPDLGGGRVPADRRRPTQSGADVAGASSPADLRARQQHSRHPEARTSRTSHPIAAVADEIRAALAGRVVVGHQVRDDVAVLSSELNGWAAPATVDTLRLAKAVWPGLPSYRLDGLAYAARIPPPTDPAGGRHRTGYDATLTAALFVILAEATDSGGHPLSAADLLASAGQSEGDDQWQCAPILARRR